MRLRRTSVTLAALAALTTLAACVAEERITEVEVGRNGVKVEVSGPRGDYEVYLVPGAERRCAEGDRLRDCAEPGDYLVSPSARRGHR